MAATTARHRAERDDNKQKSFLLELPGLLLAALLVAVVVKTFLVQPFYIPSRSMVPTLLVNDRVMVSKIGMWFSEPEPGEVVVFRNPNTSLEDESIPEAVVRSVLEALGVSASGNEDLIKRVIATGGQTVEIRDGRLLVDGVALVEPYLPQGVFMSDMEPRQLALDQIWVMGDNRNESSDSRVFGPVDRDLVVGQAVVRIWPFDRIGAL